jgi:IS30 family transposase
MVSRWAVKNPLTIDERRKIKEGIDLEMTYREIAQSLDRAKSTIQRECKRLGGFWNYDPYAAQDDFEAKQKLVGRKRK